jgi:hypothetical protein
MKSFKNRKLGNTELEMGNIKIGENTNQWNMLYFNVFTLKAL